MQHDNQLANKRQPGGEVEKRQWHIARWRWHVKRIRGGSGAKTGAPQQPAGKQEVKWRGGVSGQGAAEHQEDKRRQRCSERHHNNQPANKRQKGGRRQRIKRWQCLESWWCLAMTRAAVTSVDTLAETSAAMAAGGVH
jgi:hypothetical protein